MHGNIFVTLIKFTT